MPHTRSRLAYPLTTGPDTILTLCHTNIKTERMISTGWSAVLFGNCKKEAHVDTSQFCIKINFNFMSRQYILFIILKKIFLLTLNE